MYTLVIEKYALKNIAKIAPAQLPAIREAITLLAQNPRPQGYKKLKGISAQEITYRIIYQIHDDVITIVVIDIGHRREIYRRL